MDATKFTFNRQSIISAQFRKEGVFDIFFPTDSCFLT